MKNMIGPGSYTIYEFYWKLNDMLRPKKKEQGVKK
jgi:hypothetical protein